MLSLLAFCVRASELTCPSSGRVTCPSSRACLTCEQKITAYQQDPAWISWLALVEVETFALRDGFLPSDLLKLDDQQKTHLELFQAVPEYKDADKPKHWLRANYPIDIWNTGPLIRTWCMTFEAMLQTLKDIAANSNYRNVCKRMATIYALRTGLLLKGQKLTHWNATQLTFQGSPIVVQGGQVEQQVELKHFETLVTRRVRAALAPRILARYRPRILCALPALLLPARNVTPHASCYPHVTPARHVTRT